MKKIYSFLFCFFTIQFATAQLNGVYTIGGVSPDYVDIGTAVGDLYTFGISGPVTFNIRPGYYGTYNIGFGNFYNSDTITFQSESGNPDDVLFPFGFINNSRNLQFRNLSWNPVQPSGGSYLYKGMEISGSFNIIFDNCKIIGLNNPLSRNGMSVLHSFGHLDIHNCTFLNLDNGITYSNIPFYGSIRHSGSHIINNCVFDSVKTCIRLMGELGGSAPDSVMVRSNTMLNPESGIVMDGTAGYLAGIYIEKNNIVNASYRGIWMSYSNVAGPYRAIELRNNMISGGESATIALSSLNVNSKKAVDVYNVPYFIMENNSVQGTVYTYLTTNATFKNNCVTSDSVASLVFLGSTVMNSDYNNLYSKYSSVLGFINNIVCPTIDSIRSAVGCDMNSISKAPFFYSTTDLHSHSPYMQFAGSPLSSVDDDIDLESRDVTTPDIGADEYHASPLPPFAWFDFTCLGGNALQFTNVSVRDTTISWDFGDGNFSSLQSPSHTYASAGPFNIVLIASNSYGSDTLNYTFTFATAPSISVAGSILSVPATYTTYQWYVNGNFIMGANANSYTASVNGVYTVEVAQGTGCPATSLPVTLNVGIDEISFQNGMSISPNPASEYFLVTLLNKHKKVEYAIFDIAGKEIYSGKVFETEKLNVNTKEFSAGVYFIRIQTDNFIATQKIIIAK